MDLKEKQKELIETRNRLKTIREHTIDYNEKIEEKKINVYELEKQLKYVNEQLRQIEKELQTKQEKEFSEYPEITKNLLKQAKEAYKLQVAHIKAEGLKLKNLGA